MSIKIGFVSTFVVALKRCNDDLFSFDITGM